LRVDYAGRPLLRQALAVSGADPASLGPAMLSGHRAVGNLLRVDPGADPRLRPRGSPGPTADPQRAVMCLAGPGVLVTALAGDAVSLRRRLDHS
jgi:urease accessory protein